MKKSLLFALFFVSVFSVYAQSNSQLKSGFAITVTNATGYIVWYLYISNTAADDWGDDLLGEGVLLNEESITVRLRTPVNRTDRYDIRLGDEDGDTYTKWNILIRPDTEIVFTFDDFDGFDIE